MELRHESTKTLPFEVTLTRHLRSTAVGNNKIIDINLILQKICLDVIQERLKIRHLRQKKTLLPHQFSESTSD